MDKKKTIAETDFINRDEIDKESKGLKEKKDTSGKITEINEKIKASTGIDVSKIRGNRVEDFFELSLDPDKLRKVLFGDRKPIKIALTSYVTLPSNKQIFRFYLWFGFTKAPVIEDLPRGSINDPEKWVRKNLMDYPRMTEAVIKFISDTLQKVLPVLEKVEVTISEEELAEEVLAKIIDKVKKMEIPDDPTGASQYKIVKMKDESGVLSDYACVCGSETFKLLLKEIDSPYNKREILELCDNWEGGGTLLKKDGNRKDHKFSSNDSRRWICIKISDDILKVGGADNE